MIKDYTHADLIQRALRWLVNTKGCSIAVTEMGSGGEIPDVIGWQYTWASVVIEAKVSRADFKADLNKSFRSTNPGMGMKRYYIVPNHLRESVTDLLPDKWGLLAAGKSSVYVIRDAQEFDTWDWRNEMAIMNSIVRRVANTAQPIRGMRVKYYIPDVETREPHRELYVKPIENQEGMKL